MGGDPHTSQRFYVFFKVELGENSFSFFIAKPWDYVPGDANNHMSHISL